MTKITNEILEDYAMLYPRIECVKIGKLRNGNREDGLFIPFDYLLAKRDYPYEIEYIQLRRIESITDEEAKNIASIIFRNDNFHTSEKGRRYIRMMVTSKYEYPLQHTKWSNVASVIDYLRSIGIATPFRGITVDELVESGKLKLIK